MLWLACFECVFVCFLHFFLIFYLCFTCFLFTIVLISFLIQLYSCNIFNELFCSILITDCWSVLGSYSSHCYPCHRQLIIINIRTELLCIYRRDCSLRDWRHQVSLAKCSSSLIFHWSAASDDVTCDVTASLRHGLRQIYDRRGTSHVRLGYNH